MFTNGVFFIKKLVETWIWSFWSPNWYGMYPCMFSTGLCDHFWFYYLSFQKICDESMKNHHFSDGCLQMFFFSWKNSPLGEKSFKKNEFLTFLRIFIKFLPELRRMFWNISGVFLSSQGHFFGVGRLEYELLKIVTCSYSGLKLVNILNNSLI